MRTLITYYQFVFFAKFAPQYANQISRMFNLDLTHCPHCGGDLRVVAAILQRKTAAQIFWLRKRLREMQIRAD
jgi:hypothetical protein